MLRNSGQISHSEYRKCNERTSFGTVRSLIGHFYVRHNSYIYQKNMQLLFLKKFVRASDMYSILNVTPYWRNCDLIFNAVPLVDQDVSFHGKFHTNSTTPSHTLFSHCGQNCPENTWERANHSHSWDRNIRQFWRQEKCCPTLEGETSPFRKYFTYDVTERQRQTIKKSRV